MHGGTRLLPAALAALLRRGRPQLLVAAQPPHAPLADGVAGGLELIGEEPVAELGIIRVEVDERVGEVRVLEVAVRARVGPHL
jgi:hypothetical protein